MAVITIYVCTSYPSGGSCPSPADVMEIQWDTDWESTGPSTEPDPMVAALETHALALENNAAAMDNFFTLSVNDVGLISALMLATFITGNALGKVVAMMRKA